MYFLSYVTISLVTSGVINDLKLHEEYYTYMCLGQRRRRGVLSFHQLSQGTCDLFERDSKQSLSTFSPGNFLDFNSVLDFNDSHNM